MSAMWLRDQPAGSRAATPTGMCARDSAPARRRLSTGKQVLFSLIIVLGLIVAAEGAIRIWALYFRTSYERYNRHTGRLELVPNLRYTNARGQEFRINSRGFVGPEFDERPRPGVARVMAVGDSCTFGTGFWQIGYPSLLERRLNSDGPSARFEVINAGIEGYNSTFALDRIRDELLGYRPRLMTIYIGWNDLMKTDPANESRLDAHSWLADLLDRSYLMKAYKKLLFVNLRPLVVRPSTVEGPGDAAAYDGFVPARYRANLEAMIRLLRQQEVGVVLVTLPTVVRAGMSGDDLRHANVFFPHFAGAYGPSRLLSLQRAYNRTVLEVGARNGVEVVDLSAVFAAIDDPRPYFWDTMHPNERGHALIADTLAARIRALQHAGAL
jgi:lysophospholipase L1-like esterase